MDHERESYCNGRKKKICSGLQIDCFRPSATDGYAVGMSYEEEVVGFIRSSITNFGHILVGKCRKC